MAFRTAGFGYLWRETLGVLGGLYRKYTAFSRTTDFQPAGDRPSSLPL